MKATLVSIYRRKHRIQNSNLKSRSFRYGYLLLSLCLLFSVFVPVFAADESGNVLVNSFSASVDKASFYNVLNQSSFPLSLIPYNELNSFNFNYIGSNPFYSFEGITRVFSDYHIPDYLDFNDYNYIVFDYNVAVMSTSVLIETTKLQLFFGNSIYFEPSYDVTGDYGISVDFSGVNLTGVNTFVICELSDFAEIYEGNKLTFIRNFLDVRSTGGNQSPPVFFSPVNIKLYKNYQDIISDINNNVQQIINQNDVIINNLNEVKGQLNNIHNSLSSDKNPDNPELDSELSDANQIEQDFKDKFQDFVDLDKIDRVENIITDWTNNTKILSSFIFVRNVLDLLFDEVPVLSILFSVGSACIILTMLFGIVSHSFRSPSGNVAQDPRSYTYNYIMFSNLSQQHSLSSKKADFHAFEKSDGSWGV